MALAAVTGCRGLVLLTEFTHSSQKILQFWKSFSTQRAFPPAPPLVEQEPPLLLGTALSLFLSPLEVQLTAATDSAGKMYHIVYEEGNRE